ncbi:cyclin J18 [Prunus dulcis]|uniref:B-like cyclin n=1 Tax=Prunus dulcis TaxID=3755 RepID=A0A4Y1QRY6_PRUDU|nr:cyclin J18 [Prunus dulcis]
MQRGCASSALPLRARLIDFLIQSAHKLQVAPTVKYTALSIFAHRFYPRCLSRLEEQGNDVENWLLQPLRESNLQLFALVSLWISTKIHTSPCLSVKIFKSLGTTLSRNNTTPFEITWKQLLHMSSQFLNRRGNFLLFPGLSS